MKFVCTRKYYVHKRMLWDLHRDVGPLILKAVSQGIILLSISMECSIKCKQTEEVCPYYVQVKRYVHKRMFLFMYKEKFMYIKRIGTYTVREAHDRSRNSRENEI